MDIAKYIGLFLIKNEYCYLPGIGSLEIVKKPAVYNKENGQMDAPQYEVVYERGAGSIDDSFANFIANNERISIAHAANYLKDYCAAAKKRLNDGVDIDIPGIGRFFRNDGGTIDFLVDPNLQVKGRSIPIFKNSPSVASQREEALTNIIERTEIREPKANEEIVIKPPQINWVKIIVLALLVLGVLAAVGYFLLKPSGESPVVSETDDTAQQVAPVPTTPAPEQASGFYLVSLKEYPNFEAAERRSDQLNSYGNEVSVYTRDSQVYHVVMRLPDSVAQRDAVDSLKRLFNPLGDVKVLP